MSLLDQPNVVVWIEGAEWRWRCETCDERSKQTFTREVTAALDAGRHVRASHAVPVDFSPGWTQRQRKTTLAREFGEGT